MPYSTSPLDVRELAGGVSTSDYSDSEIVQDQETAKDIVDLKTGRTWSSSDSSWELIVTIESLYAAALVLLHFGPSHKDEAEKLWQKAAMLIEDITGSDLTGVTGGGALFASSNYKSHILGLEDDPDTIPYRSTKERRIY